MIRTTAMTCVLLSLAAAQSVKPDVRAPSVDLAICLDTSGSMRGLIDAARQNIWAIVNDLAFAKPTPKFRIALLTFGNTGNRKEDGWVKLEVGLTNDLDKVSEKLFALTTSGGDEFVGRVLDAATQRLEWSKDPKALKIVIVAGNEGADQDRVVSYKVACKAAIERGILVNSVFCGNPMHKDAPGWVDVAKRADGAYASIDHNKQQVVIPTPFDNRLTELSTALNATYIAYGSAGLVGKANQVAQDINARNVNLEVNAQRAWTKCNPNYICSWDLVTNLLNKKIDLEKLDKKLLPENLRKMSTKELKEHVETMRKTRAEVQKKIADVTVKREKWLVDERKRRALKKQRSFDFEVRNAIRRQAEAKGLEYAKLTK